MLESTQTFNGLLEERFYLKTTFPQKKSQVVLSEHVSRNTLSITSTLNLETTKKTDIMDEETEGILLDTTLSFTV